MNNTSRVGAMIAGSIIATVVLLLLFGGWLWLFPAQADRLELGILLILIQIPIAGSAIGVLAGSLLSRQPSTPARRPASSPALAPGPRGTSQWDGVVFLIIALLPGLWSVWVFASDWSGAWKQILSSALAAVFFLGPVAATIGLVVCGIATIRQCRAG